MVTSRKKKKYGYIYYIYILYMWNSIIAYGSQWQYNHVSYIYPDLTIISRHYFIFIIVSII